MTDLSSWVADGIAVAAAIIAVWSAVDARRSSRDANRINQELLDLQRADTARRLVDEAQLSEARKILARARMAWTLIVADVLRKEPFARIDGPQQEGIAHALRAGVVVPWEGTVSEEMGVYLTSMPGVVLAEPEERGYRVRFRFDSRTFQLEP